MKPVTAVLIGAGIRGKDTYAAYALTYPDQLKFVAVAEPDTERREQFKKAHNLSDDACFSDWKELLEKPKMADAALICTQDKMHYEPSVKALDTGYHILLEKPMTTDAQECIDMGRRARESGKVFNVCHVLRHTPFFLTIKSLLDEGAIGRLVSITHNENVGYWHQAHSFVRGHYRNSSISPMILAKSCHDMDILLWLAGRNCLRISSFGSLTHFKSENAPAGAPKRCTDGCPHEKECKYSAPALYLTDDTNWPTSAISNDMSYESRLKALKEGPYGRCVYRCDNNVVDHQVVNIEFEDGITAAFTMCAFTNEVSRTIKLMGTTGEIRGHMEKNEIEVINFGETERKHLCLKGSRYGHGGGDYEVVREFVHLIQTGENKGRASAETSVQGTLMAFAAEEARLTNRVVSLSEYY